MNSILYVSPFAFGVSGADESLLSILGELSTVRFRTWVALPIGSPYIPRYKKAGAHVISLPLLRLKRTRNPLYWLVFLLWTPFEVVLLVILMRSKKIDLLHNNMESTLSAPLAAKLLRIPTVLHYRGNSSDLPKWFFDLFLPLLHALADHLFVISHAVAKGFQVRGLTRRMEVLYNALPLTPFLSPSNRTHLLERIPGLTNKKIITYVGRIHPRKRIEDLLDAASLLGNDRLDLAFVIVGGDPRIAQERSHLDVLRTRLSSLKPAPEVYFLGHESDISKILHGSDLFILPSIDEGFGRAVIEALVAGVPVITSDSGAFPEILQNGKYGILVPPKSPKDLAQAIVSSLEDPSRLEKAKDAQSYATQMFDIRNHVRRIEATYERLLKS